MDSSEQLILKCRECQGEIYNYKLALCRKCDRRQNFLIAGAGLVGVGLLVFLIWCGVK